MLRRHETIPHTADVGIRVEAEDLAGLFGEAASAVAEIAADVDPSRPATADEEVEVEAADLPGLAFAWLNELIGLIDIHGPLVRADVDEVDVGPGGGWRLRGRAAFSGRAVPRLDIKSATYHSLVVEREGGGWRLIAYLDV